METLPLIHIHNLSCSYSLRENEKVLHIADLALGRGKIIFLLGASGTGKSTLLETLGLMNNTIASGTVDLNTGDGTFNYTELWKNDHTDQINRIRKNFLSFIFQNTNLMENFTAYENICLAQMIKSNAVQSQVMEKAITLMEQVRLPEKEVGFNTLSVNLSGGQRQRVSFVRALNSNYQLLLCDEPTGNLDEVNAHELLSIVRANLSADKTAVLVSHDVNLALKYADEIILITKNPEGYGEIISENIFQREQWTSMDQQELLRFRTSLVHLFLPEKTRVAGEAEVKKIPGSAAKVTYTGLFRRKESKILFGKSLVNLAILVAIITFTLVAIGFANGTLHYLNTKIRDPFVNWITIVLPGVKSEALTVKRMKNQLNEEDIKATYLLKSVTAYKETPLLFFPIGKTESEFSKGRLMSIDDPIAADLFGADNLIRGDSAFRNENDISIVVTQKLLTRLKYPDDAKVIYIDNNDKDATKGDSLIYQVPVPIRAVLREIPNKNNFIIGNYFYSCYATHEESVFDYNIQRKNIYIYTGTDKDFALKLKKEAEENLSTLPGQYEAEDISIDVEQSDQLMEKGSMLVISFNTIPESALTTESLYKEVMSLPAFNKNKEHLVRLFNYDMAELREDDIRQDYLSVNFSSLDNIDAFSKYVNKTMNAEGVKEEGNFIEIDSGIIKEKNNFNYMSKMTLLISGLLITFSVLAISLFISNLLKTHLNKVKSNLGTYKAFGLSNSESIRIYLTIMLQFIFIALVASLILALGIGKSAEALFASQLKIEDQTTYFRLFDLQTYIVITTIVFVTCVVSYYNINRILSKTPGDLIYNR